MVKDLVFQRICVCILTAVLNKKFIHLLKWMLLCRWLTLLFSSANPPPHIPQSAARWERVMAPQRTCAVSEDGGLMVWTYSQAHTVLSTEMICVWLLGFILCVYVCQRSTFLWKSVSKMKLKGLMWRKGQELLFGLCWGKVTHRNRLKENERKCQVRFPNNEVH